MLQIISMVLFTAFIIILNCLGIFSLTQLPPIMGLHQSRKFVIFDLCSFRAQLSVFPLVLSTVDDVTIEQVV